MEKHTVNGISSKSLTIIENSDFYDFVKEISLKMIRTKFFTSEFFGVLDRFDYLVIFHYIKISSLEFFGAVVPNAQIF